MRMSHTGLTQTGEAPLGAALFHSHQWPALVLEHHSPLPSSQMDSCPGIKRGILINICPFGIHDSEMITRSLWDSQATLRLPQSQA